MADPQLPLRFDVQVPPGGRIEVTVPLPAQSRATVYVVPQSETQLDDLLAASISSMDFWDNPEDDEDWNDA
jgi:hypothetical protein